MNKFIQRIINYILRRRRNRLAQTLERMKPHTYIASTTKTHINASETLTINAETQKIIEVMQAQLVNIIKACSLNTDKILEYVQTHGTSVYKIANADKILAHIKEEEGFISPLKGWKAFYLNFWIGLLCDKKLNFSFKTKEMFVVKNTEIDIYFILHQFHLWFGFTKGLPGYDDKSRELLKTHIDKMSDADVNSMTMEEIIGLKEAVARDKEAAEFVVRLAKETSGAKKALEKMRQDGGANV